MPARRSTMPAASRWRHVVVGDAGAGQYSRSLRGSGQIVLIHRQAKLLRLGREFDDGVEGADVESRMQREREMAAAGRADFQEQRARFAVQARFPEAAQRVGGEGGRGVEQVAV